MSRPLNGLLLLLLALFAPLAAWAHVGSKDVFQTVNAGPYTLYVTVRPPSVIPGVATVEVRSTGAPLDALQVVALPVTGEAARHAPQADHMERSPADPSFYTGAVWMMAAGAWQVRVQAQGAGGSATATVPVLAVPTATLGMNRGLQWTLGVLGIMLIVLLAGVVGAAMREARLAPGLEPTPTLRRRGLVAAGAALLVLVGAVVLGNRWWNVEAASYGDNIFKPAPVSAKVKGDQLDLLVAKVIPAAFYSSPRAGSDPRKFRGYRGDDDFLPDHGRLIHLYAIRMPEMDAAFHLHPILVAAGDFRGTLPDMPAGHYLLYGDVVHRNGFPETLQASMDLPGGITGSPLGGEDASAHPAPLEAGVLGNAYKLPDGYSMTWDRPATLAAGQAYTLHFHLLDPQGRSATAMEPYLGMAGHAAFVKADGSTFAHTHPEGSAAMADVMLAQESLGQPMAMDAPQTLTAHVGFPYGFPAAGRYRVFVQMKHAGVVETGVFDAEVK